MPLFALYDVSTVGAAMFKILCIIISDTYYFRSYINIDVGPTSQGSHCVVGKPAIVDLLQPYLDVDMEASCRSDRCSQ